MRSLNDSHDFRPFFNTMLWCAEGRHEPKQIAEWIRESPFPIDAVRDHLAYALAIATLEGITERGDLDTQTEAFVPQARADRSRSELCRRGDGRRGGAARQGGVSTGLFPRS